MKAFGIFFVALIALIALPDQSNIYARDRDGSGSYNYRTESTSSKYNSDESRGEGENEYVGERNQSREEYDSEKRERTYNPDTERGVQSSEDDYYSRRVTRRPARGAYSEPEDKCPFFNKSSKSVVFYNAIGTSSFAVRALLECSKVNYKSIPVNLKKHTYMEEGIEKSLYDITKKGTVPIFKHGSMLYTEGPAILFYISDKCGSYNLPADSKYTGLEVINFVATDIFRNATPIFGGQLNNSSRAHFVNKIKEKLTILDITTLGNKHFFIENRLTIVDFYVFAIFLIIKSIPEINLEEFQNLPYFFENMQNMPCVNQAFRVEIEENQKNNSSTNNKNNT
jgi:glutathione S-transferase